MKKSIIVVCLMFVFNSAFAEDQVTINDFMISPGETRDVLVTLNNDVEYAAFQFDLYLPEGISLVSWTANRDRLPEKTTLSMYNQPDGAYRFLAYTMAREPIVGSSGTIISLTVKAADSMPVGESVGYFRNVKLSKVDATGSTYAEMPFPVIGVVLGDVNGDGDIDIADAVCVVNHIVDKPTSVFIESAADVNNDSEVDIADAVRIVNYLVGKIDTLAQ